MTVAFDAWTPTGAITTFTTTSPHNVNHTPAGTPRAVVVLITQNVGTSDQITGVTYGGTAMTRVPTHGFVARDGSNDGAVYAYFLGSSIPTGTQTVAISHTGTSDVKAPVIITFTAAADTEIGDADSLSALQSDPQLSLTSSGDSITVGMLWGGLPSPASYTAVTGQSAVSSSPRQDFGLQSCIAGRQTSAAGTSFTFGFTSASADSALIAVAVQEAAGGGTSITAVALDVTPTLPAAAIQVAGEITAQTLTATPSLPAADVQGNTVEYHVLTGQSFLVGHAPALTTTARYPDIVTELVDSSGVPIDLRETSVQRPSSTLGWGIYEGRPSGTLVNLTTHGGSGVSLDAINGSITTTQLARLDALVDAVAPDVVILYGVHLMQGERDQVLGNSIADYLTDLETFHGKYQTDARALTGQSGDILGVFQDQMCQHDVVDMGPYPRIALAQLQAHRDYAWHYLVGARYHLPYQGDDTHLTNVGLYKLGEYHAKAHVSVRDGNGWEPVAPREITRSGLFVTIRFHVPVEPLVFDTTQFASQTNMGFRYHDTNDVTSETTPSATIVDVQIDGPDSVVLELDQAPATETGHVSYGWKLRGGNLRDSDTFESQYDATPLQNWGVHFYDPVREDVAFARPDSDIAIGGWTDQLGGTTDLWSVVDEAQPDESDHARSAQSPSADVLLLGLTTIDDPGVHIGHVVSYRYAKAGNEQVDLTVRLFDGATEIAEWVHTDVSATPQTAHQELSEIQAGNITDYADLRIEFEAN